MNIRDLDAQARAAYHAAGHTGRGIIFAVFDTGVRPVGPLKGHVLPGTPDGLTDNVGHGTFVAGELIEWCPDAQILSFRVLPKGVNDPTSPIIAQLEKLLPIVKADPTHRYVVNMSLSGAGNLADPEIQRYKAAIDALVAADVPVFVAAGNDGQETLNLFPSCLESPITVAAVDETGKWAGFSTHHKNVDFTALGKDVLGLNLDLGIMAAYLSGTSMATPNLAGPGGLLIDTFGLSEPKLYETMKLLALDLGDSGYDPYYGWGWVDIKTPDTVKTLLGAGKKEDTTMTRRTLLRRGMKGDDVRELQTLLLKQGFDPQGVDGDFGPKTEAAVKAYQAARGLSVTGVVDTATWAALDAPMTAPAPIPGAISRDALIAKVLSNAAALLGTSYSQDARNNIWPGGKMDCSSYTAAIWAAAGLPLLTKDGDELRSSYREVDAAGFDLVWPASRALIGKLPSPKGLLSSYGAQAGDIVFWCFNTASGRANNITHVGNIDAGAKNIIHISNNTDKCCRKPLDYGDGKICAIIRLRSDVTLPALPDVALPAESKVRADEWVVRALQVALNIQHSAKLVCDGLMGSKTAAAIKALNATLGVNSSACTAATWSALGFANNGGQITAPTPAEPEGDLYVYAGSSYVNIRKGPGTTYDKLPDKLSAGEQCRVLEAKDGWAHIRKGSTEGWCIATWLRRV